MEFVLAIFFLLFCFYLIFSSFLKIIRYIFWNKKINKLEDKKYSFKIVWDKWDIIEFLVELKQKGVINWEEYKKKLDEIKKFNF